MQFCDTKSDSSVNPGNLGPDKVSFICYGINILEVFQFPPVLNDAALRIPHGSNSVAYYKCYGEQDAASLSGVITNAHFIVRLQIKIKLFKILNINSFKVSKIAWALVILSIVKLNLVIAIAAARLCLRCFTAAFNQ